MALIIFGWNYRSGSNVECAAAVDLSETIGRINQSIENCCECAAVEIVDDNRNVEGLIDSLRRIHNGRMGAITVTLSWSTTDDLDLLLVEPNGNKIYFEHPNSSDGGHLDVDMNREGNGNVTDPIENIYYDSTPQAGTYQVFVYNFKRFSDVESIPYKVFVKSGERVSVYNGVHYFEKDYHQVCSFQFP